MINYFELMNSPEQFDIDMSRLQQTLRELQAKFHPDSYVQTPLTGSAGESSLLTQNHINANLAALKPEQASAIINEAYNVLKNPDSRASHLLNLKGIAQSINQPIRDLDFLDDAMTFRIELDEANAQSIGLLQQKLTKWLDAYEREFSEIYQKLTRQPYLKRSDMSLSHQNELTSIAVALVQKLQFLVKLQLDLDKKTDELTKYASGDDDELYV